MSVVSEAVAGVVLTVAPDNGVPSAALVTNPLIEPVVTGETGLSLLQLHKTHPPISVIAEIKFITFCVTLTSFLCIDKTCSSYIIIVLHLLQNQLTAPGNITKVLLRA